jgi:hypothetical protein
MPEMKPEEPDFLSRIKVEVPFKVPQGYFEALPSNLSEKLQKTPNKRFSAIWFQHVGIAASFSMVIFCAAIFFFSPSVKPILPIESLSDTQTLEDVIEEEGVLEYVDDEEFIVEFDKELAALYPNNHADTSVTDIEEIILTEEIDELDLYLEM